MANNEIKLDQKATNYLKDKIGGGGTGGTTVVANPELSGDEDSLNGLEVDGTKYVVSGGMNVIDFNGITINDFNEGFYNQIMNSFNENNPTFVKNVSEIAATDLIGLIPVIVSRTQTVYEGVDCEVINFYFIYDSETFTIQVLDNDYVRVSAHTLVEEE